MKRGNTCSKAQSLITGDRASAYGDALDDFIRISKLFFAATGVSVRPDQVPIFMICVKLSREFNRHQDDNMIDICGYADLRNSIEIEPETLPEPSNAR